VIKWNSAVQMEVDVCCRIDDIVVGRIVGKKAIKCKCGGKAWHVCLPEQNFDVYLVCEESMMQAN